MDAFEGQTYITLDVAHLHIPIAWYLSIRRGPKAIIVSEGISAIALLGS